MAKNLLIVESPAKAKTIEKYLGGDFTVKASYGHVRDLPKGDNAIDIDNHFEPQYEIIPDKKSVIKELQQLIKKADTVWLATDEDREGEAISWHLAVALGLDVETTHRIVFNEITRPAIEQAIKNPRTINQDLVNAQQARRVLDRIVGFQLSPILWRKVRGGLSAGRVQSVAVRLIVEREREIMAFNTSSAFQITAQLIVDKSAKIEAKLPQRFDTEAEARTFLESCIGADYKIVKLEKKPAKKSPAAPFTTSTLQQEASRKLGFSVTQTMRVAQTLYEEGKITYMRTDSVSLSEQAMQHAEAVITKDFGPQYHHARRFKNKNTSAQEAHEAIRPSDLSASQVEGGRNEQRLYELIWKRTLASQMADAQIERTIVDIEISTNREILKATGEVLKFDGFLRLYLESTDDEPEDEETSGVLPPMEVGQLLNLEKMIALQRFTRPAPRYTEASLVKRLEELGIGRPSTYAPTISTIQKREYTVKESRTGENRSLTELILQKDQIRQGGRTEVTGADKNKLFPTDLGMVVNDFLVKFFPSILDFSFTAKVEEEFDAIAEGKITWSDMIGAFYQDFAPQVEEITESAERAGGERELGIDPKSGKVVVARLGRYGPMIQIGATDADEKPQYAKLRADQRLETITLEEAMELFKLPRTLGEFEGETVKANIGRFGPYVQLGKLFVSLKEGDDPYDIELSRAIELIKEKRDAEANRVIKQFSEDAQVLRGRYGPYIKIHGENVRIPKGTEPETLTLEVCEQLYEENKDKPKRSGGGGRGGGVKKKA